jgi:hypothetical protein
LRFSAKRHATPDLGAPLCQQDAEGAEEEGPVLPPALGEGTFQTASVMWGGQQARGRASGPISVAAAVKVSAEVTQVRLERSRLIYVGFTCLT